MNGWLPQDTNPGFERDGNHTEGLEIANLEDGKARATPIAEKEIEIARSCLATTNVSPIPIQSHPLFLYRAIVMYETTGLVVKALGWA